jgi:hypothetical protein
MYASIVRKHLVLPFFNGCHPLHDVLLVEGLHVHVHVGVVPPKSTTSTTSLTYFILFTVQYDYD